MTSTVGGEPTPRKSGDDDARKRKGKQIQEETEEDIQREKGLIVASKKEHWKKIVQSYKIPALLSSSNRKSYSETYFPFSEPEITRRLDLSLQEWNIIGHDPFTHWIMLVHCKKIRITNGLEEHNLSEFPSDMNCPRFGHVFDASCSVVVLFGETRFKVYWHLDDTWKSAEYVEPKHNPQGFVVVHQGRNLMWINLKNGTLHIMRNFRHMDEVTHESYNVDTQFRPSLEEERKGYFVCGVVGVTPEEQVYFVRTKVSDGNYSFSVFKLKFYLLIDVAEMTTEWGNLDKLTFFVSCNHHYGFALEMRDEANQDKVIYAGYKHVECVTITGLGNFYGHVSVEGLKACYDVVYYGGTKRCNCNHMWFLYGDPSEIPSGLEEEEVESD